MDRHDRTFVALCEPASRMAPHKVTVRLIAETTRVKNCAWLWWGIQQQPQLYVSDDEWITPDLVALVVAMVHPLAP